MIAQAETNAIDLGEVRRVLISVAAFTAIFELTAAVLLTWTRRDHCTTRDQTRLAEGFANFD